MSAFKEVEPSKDAILSNLAGCISYSVTVANSRLNHVIPLIALCCSLNLCIVGRGGWKSKPGQLQKNKMNINILRQEKLIAEKKKEIEARMAEQAKMSAQATSKPPER